jgi:hypothetical protein
MNVEIELHTLCFDVLQVHVLGKIHTREPSNRLAVVDNKRACERERRSVTTYDINWMRYGILPEISPSIHARADVLRVDCTFFVARIALNYCMHVRTGWRQPELLTFIAIFVLTHSSATRVSVI